MPALADDEREVTVVLCGGDGAVLGQLVEPVRVRPQWWPEVDPVLAALQRRFGLVVTVLRLLTTETPTSGGSVSYLAQLRSGPPTRHTPPHGHIAAALDSDSTHRLWWAEPGGLDHLPSWFDAALRAHGRERTGALRQRKTWNLSVVVTASTDDGEVWFKATPPFLADEGGMIRRVAAVDPALVPTVLAHDPGRRAILMDHVPGEDQFGLTDEAVAEAMVRRWVGVQAALTGDVEHVLALGARDLRAAPLLREVESLVGREEVRADLDAADLAAVEALVAGLPDRLDEIAACGLPDTVLHGDMHPGNWRRDGDRLTLLDWGDVGVGNPMVDQRAFVERLANSGQQERISALWAGLWRDLVPGSEPERAAYLLGPVAQLAAAATYQRFLDHIEVTERVYHRPDPADRLRAAVRSAAR
ncbi:MAG TPA: aminoglycoside phosphotransferase family protein [Lapillicoccus sp.]|nr:aminoglycoside phosphotransferase family protein [Lapillicoccus sp.]